MNKAAREGASRTSKRPHFIFYTTGDSVQAAGASVPRRQHCGPTALSSLSLGGAWCGGQQAQPPRSTAAVARQRAALPEHHGVYLIERKAPAAALPPATMASSRRYAVLPHRTFSGRSGRGGGGATPKRFSSRRSFGRRLLGALLERLCCDERVLLDPSRAARRRAFTQEHD